MRRTSVAAVAALVLSICLFPGTDASAADQPRVRYYEGTTSGGGRLGISVVVRHDVPYLRMVLIDGPYGCEDGTQGDIALDGFVWWPSDLAGPIIANEPFDVSGNVGSFAFMLSGSLRAFRGSGTLTVLMPTVTADEQAAQLCTFGGTWSVERLDTFPLLARTVRVEDTDGRPTRTGFALPGTRSLSSLTQARAGSIRHYRGRTSQGEGMKVQTARADAGIALHHMDFGSELACEDGEEIGVGIYPHAFFDTTQVMPRRRLDLDIAPAPDALPLRGFALHVHGELDAHLGSGTLSMIWPTLTEDLQAQLCQTGDQTWRLWRTDAGF